jgi:hypothetical protein
MKKNIDEVMADLDKYPDFDSFLKANPPKPFTSMPAVSLNDTIPGNAGKLKPILFSTEMVKAIQAGTKTQTRRLKTKFEVGDVLWVRETTCYVMLDHAHDLLEGAKDRNQFVYKTNVHPDWMIYANEKYGYTWKPSIFMPKSACRLFLKVTKNHAERLQDISEADAVAEGVDKLWAAPLWYNYTDNRYTCATAVESYKTLWEKINGRGSWDENPIVWVSGFHLVERPEGFCS